MLMAANESLYAMNTLSFAPPNLFSLLWKGSLGDWIHIQEQFEVVLIHYHSIKQASLAASQNQFILFLEISFWRWNSSTTHWLNTSPTQRDWFWMYERKWNTIGMNREGQNPWISLEITWDCSESLGISQDHYDYDYDYDLVNTKLENTLSWQG